MNNNEFKLDLQAVLEKAKSIANIKRDIKIIEAKLSKIKIQGTLNSASTRKELNTKLKSVNPKVKMDADTTLVEKKMKKLNQQKSNPTVTPAVDNSQVVSGVKEAQKETKTLWERFTNGIIGTNLIRMGIQEVTKAIRQAIANVKELDAIKTNIQMVSGTSDSGVNAMMSGYNSMAKDLSSTTKDVAEAANEFLRMGESVASTNELIKSSQVLSKVGMLESAESASYLISSLQGYKIAAENSMDVVSKLTSVDLEAAVSAGGLAEALSKCADIADNSGISMDRLIGYTATVGETTQKSMSEVGNSFQSIFSRMNNIKLGIWTDENGESLSNTEKVLNKLGIQLRDTEDSYRSFDSVLDDIGSRWKNFSKAEQYAISVAIAGTSQNESFEALMNNYGNALKYAETAANSAGSALERYGIYQDSIQAKTNELTAAVESLSTNVISEDLYRGIIEATTGVVEFIDKTNLLKGTLAGLVTVGVAKTIASVGAGFITAAKSTAQLTVAMALFDKGTSVPNLQSIGMACKGLSEKQLKLILSTKGLNTHQRLAILEGMGLEEQEQKQTLATLGFAAAEDKATISTFSLKGAFDSLRTVIAANPMAIGITAIIAATYGAMKASEAWTNRLRNQAQESSDAYQDRLEEIKSINSELQSNGQRIDELNAKENLTLVETEELGKLKESNRELENTLALKEKIAQQEKANANKDAVKYFEEDTNTYNNKTGKFSSTHIELATQYLDEIYKKEQRIHEIELEMSRTDDKTEKYRELSGELDVTQRSYEDLLQRVQDYNDVFTDLDDYLFEGQDDELIRQLDTFYKYMNEVLYGVAETNTNAIRDILAKADFQETSKQLEELGKSGELSVDILSSRFPELIEYLEKAGISAEELYQYIMALSNPDALNYPEVERQFRESLGIRDGEIKGASDQKIWNETKDSFSEDEWQIAIEAYLKVRDQYGEHPEGWTAKDWISNIQSELENEIVGIDAQLSISDTIDQLNTRLKPAFDSLQSAYRTIFTDDGFDLNSIDILSTCDSIKSKLDEMSGLGLDVDYSAFENLVRVLRNTESTEQDVEKAFDSLAASITQAGLSGTEDF